MPFFITGQLSCFELKEVKRTGLVPADTEAQTPRRI
jgi:hypothetical protein